MSKDGGRVMAFAAFLALCVAIHDFFAPTALLAPLSDVQGTLGAGIAIFGCLMLIIAGLVLGGRRRNILLVGIFIIGGLAGILGTALAANLLGSWVLFGLMAFCLIGWLMRVFGGAPRSETA